MTCFFCEETRDEGAPVPCLWCGKETTTPHLVRPNDDRQLGFCHDCSVGAQKRIESQIQEARLKTDVMPPSSWKRLGMWGIVKALGLQREGE